MKRKYTRCGRLDIPCANRGKRDPGRCMKFRLCEYQIREDRYGEKALETTSQKKKESESSLSAVSSLQPTSPAETGESHG